MAFSCLSGSLNCGDRRLCFQEVGNRHLFPGSAIWRAFFTGNKIKTNMSECSSYSTDANQPGEKLDLCVSGLMVLLYASGNKGAFACGWWRTVCVCVRACVCLCGGMHTLMHIHVPGSIYLTLRWMLLYHFEPLVVPDLEALSSTGDKSFKVSQSDISRLPLPKKQEETLSSHHQTLSCKARNSKDLSVWKIRRV